MLLPTPRRPFAPRWYDSTSKRLDGAPRREARRTATARLIGSAVSLLFIETLGYVTWAWKERPQLLSQGLLDVIEDFRNNFK